MEKFDEYSETLQMFEALGGYNYINQKNIFFEKFNLNNFIHRAYSSLSGGEQ